MDDDVELRVALDEAVEEAFELADALVVEVGLGNEAETARIAANYLLVRTSVRRLRRALKVAVAG